MAKRTLTRAALVERLNSAIDEVVESWKELQQGSSDERFCLYFYMPSDRERVGRLKAASKDPKRGWRLATSMRFQRRWSESEAQLFVRHVVMRLPFVRGPIESTKACRE